MKKDTKDILIIDDEQVIIDAAFREELAELGAAQLPLQQGLTSASHALDSRIQVMILGTEADADRIRVRAGIFYSGVIAGCNCADDPSPVGEQNEYCEVQIDLDRATARAAITLLA